MGWPARRPRSGPSTPADTAQPTMSVNADVTPLLLPLDLRLREVVGTLRSDVAARAADPFRGLVITDDDVDGLLAAEGSLDDGHIAARLASLRDLFELNDFELEALLVCLAPEIDLRYERLYAYLQDDVAKKRPTVDLVLRLLHCDGSVEGRDALGPGGKLQGRGLLALADPAAAGWPLLARPLRPDERVTSFLLGSDVVDGRIGGFASLETGDPHLAAPSAEGEELRGLSRVLASKGRPVVYVHGAAAPVRRELVVAAGAAAGSAVLMVDVRRLIEADASAAGLALAAREALLQGAVLCLDGADELLQENTAEQKSGQPALRALLRAPGAPLVMLGATRWEPGAWQPGLEAVRVELPAQDEAQRREMWRRHLDGQLPPEDVDELAARYRLDEQAVRAVAGSARLQAAWHGEATLRGQDAQAAARAIAAPPMAGLARRVEPRYGWDDIVLTADRRVQLREICERARHQGLVMDGWGYARKHARRRGLTALFAGESGTGKTMAAEIIAGDLSLELYRIDMAAVVSKYIGETEKNLERIFQSAEQGDAVLLFDEADALFGKRSEVRDAHDRYANVEIAYLLQRLESYDGPAILTTNLRGNLDEAFVRRLDFAVEFPLPDEAERLDIWRKALPAEAPLADDVDLAFLASKFRLAGGHIRNIALAAGFLAAPEAGPIGMRHLVRATRREYQKLGKLVAEADFERYYPLLKDD